MYEKVEVCPVCHKDQFKLFRICKDFTVSKESFALSECLNCSFKFTNPRPTEEKLQDFYQSEDYISHQNKSNNLINLIYKIVRRITLSQKIKLIESLQPKGKILDVGCGTGHFLDFSKKKGWQVFGTEPYPGARKIAQSLTDSEIYPDLKHIEEDKFNVITLWHVLEHIPGLEASLKIIRKALENEGLLVVALPNYKSFDAEKYQDYWAGYDVPRHLYHFDPKTIKSLMSKLKFRLIQTHPMKFDAYYVSLLSEKYIQMDKNGKLKPGNMLDAFNTGVKSNRQAKLSGNYSSLIYLFKK